jgi:hypothetical protein
LAHFEEADLTRNFTFTRSQQVIRQLMAPPARDQTRRIPFGFAAGRK